MIDTATLKKLKSIELHILKVVTELCDKNDIKYYLIGGTLLGAVRHKGFIPWDDDIDIAMLRSDYEKFIELWHEVQPHDLIMQNKETDERVHQSFTKIRKRGTKFIVKETKNSGIFQGIFIDIFPLDNIPPKDNVFMEIDYLIFQYLMGVSLYKNGYRLYKNSIIKCILAISSFLPFIFINKISYNIITKYNNYKMDYCTSYASGYGYKKYRMKRGTFYDEGVMLLFEGYHFRCPSNYKEYLTQFFGDYMRLPPVEERVSRHKIIEINLDEE